MKELKDPALAARFLTRANHMARVLMSLKKHAEAETLLDRGLDIAKEFNVEYTPAFAGPLVIPFPPGCCCLPGDSDGNNKVNIADVMYLIARIFADGPAPQCGGGN